MGSSGSDQLKQLGQLKGRRSKGVFKPKAGAKVGGTPVMESDPEVVAQYRALAEKSRRRKRIITIAVLLSIGALFGGVMYWFGHASI